MLFKFPSIEPIYQGAKKFSFTACQSGTCSYHNTILNVISTGAKKKKQNGLAVITVLLKFLNSRKKLHFPVGQIKNRIHQPNSKIHSPFAIRHDFLFFLFNFLYQTPYMHNFHFFSVLLTNAWCWRKYSSSPPLISNTLHTLQ